MSEPAKKQWTLIGADGTVQPPSSAYPQLPAMFVRARQPEDTTLGGISTRGLVSARDSG
jgi:hypothetical protein